MAHEPTRLMAHVAPKGQITIPRAADCMAHRCGEHRGVSMHNANGPQQSECGACVMADVEQLWNEVLLPMMDGYAARLTHHRVLLEKLREARARLNLVAPGAGDYLDADLS